MSVWDYNDAERWLKKKPHYYPLTIFTQRYGCTKHFVAMAREFDEVGEDAIGGDMEALTYWDELDKEIANHNTAPYGEGDTIEEAIESLCQRLQEYIDWWHELRRKQEADPECQAAKRRFEGFLKSISPLKSANVRDTIDLTSEIAVKKED